MNDNADNLAIGLVSEILALEIVLRSSLTKMLPKGMELSHYVVLNHLSFIDGERSPAQLAASLNVTRGAMTNTLSKLEWAGYIHITPDWEDARRKNVVISPAGRAARDAALQKISPVIKDVAKSVGDEELRNTLPVLRDLRIDLSQLE